MLNPNTHSMRKHKHTPSSLRSAIVEFTHLFPPTQQFSVITEAAAPPPPSALYGGEETRHKSAANLLEVNCDLCQVIAWHTEAIFNLHQQ